MLGSLTALRFWSKRVKRASWRAKKKISRITTKNARRPLFLDLSLSQESEHKG